MSTQFKIAIAQLNFLVGDIEGNAGKVIEAVKTARLHLGADVIVFPELTLTSYPPEDLLLRPGLYPRVEEALEKIRQQVKGIDVVLGFPQSTPAGNYNAATLIRDGEVVAVYHKQVLPNYGVFDEKRLFQAGHEPCVVEIKGVPVGLSICEDIWFLEPMRQAAEAGARLILNINASPFHIDKSRERASAIRSHIEKINIPVVYVNLVGGQDELVFDGASFVMNSEGEITHSLPAFEEGVFMTHFEIENSAVVPMKEHSVPSLTEVESAYQAIVLGVRDYIHKNGFPGVIIGLSGGIDSALTLAIAVDAIGAENVEAVMMPSRYTSQQSKDDARKEAQNLGVEFHELSIEPIFDAALDTLREEFSGMESDVTEENIQARARCMLLMAISNKKNKMVLTTGNKSEMAVGYATLYGDMAGGFNALKDVPKTLVYRLAEHRNTLSYDIPQSVIHRAPSAELKPDQKDSDSLPDYGELDGILELYVEHDKSAADIVAEGYDQKIVEKVIHMVDGNEYKRRQAAPGVRITRRAFGRDRRYPITSGFNKR
jgi:NAD+ synthase (glutamine-hydrolysing)